MQGKGKKNRANTIIGLICCGIVFYVTWTTIQETFFSESELPSFVAEKERLSVKNVTAKQGEIEYTKQKMVQFYTVTEDEFSELQTSEYDVYQDADTASEIVDTVYVGEWATYLDETNLMTKIRTKNGIEGYVLTQQLRQTQEISLRNNTSLKDFAVMLDAGHGGDDPGSLSNDDTLYEKDFTLQTAKAIKSKLEQAGITVYMTREEDETVSLDQRVALAEKEQPDLFISIHYDSYPEMNAMSGFTTYYYYPRDEALGNAINTELTANLPLDGVGLRDENHLVTRENPYPSLLLELGYMNSDYDVSVVQKDAYLESVAESVLGGIVNYYQ